MFSTVLPFLLAISGISAQCLTGNDYPMTMNPISRMLLIDARLKFAVESLMKTAKIQMYENIFFSPHSLHQAISLAYYGARGTTEASLKRTLHIPDDMSKIEVQRYYSFERTPDKTRDTENVSESYEYKMANRLWVADDRKIRECMLDFFGEELQKTNFAINPEAARIHINNWVSNTTKGQIRDLLPPTAIDSSTDLVLVNAVYFKGLWAHRFDPKDSKRDIFYTSGSENFSIKYMRQKGNFNYVVSDDLGAYVLELPYKGQDISMFILLPPFSTTRFARTNGEPQSGIRQLVERLATERGLQELRELLDGRMPFREVEVSFPRFAIERDLPVKDLLNALGAGELISQSADLRGFVDDGEPSLHLGDAVHRARIEVTEEGTTAAAATALFSFRSSRPTEPAVFNANHPFVYLIYNKANQTILFTGVFRKPPEV